MKFQYSIPLTRTPRAKIRPAKRLLIKAERKVVVERVPCMVCGGRRGFVQAHFEYPSHKTCYQRVPGDYVLWFIKEGRR